MRRVNLSNESPLPQEILAEHSYNIQTRGYSLVPGFLDSATVAYLKETLVRALGDYKPKAGVERSFQDRHQLHDLMIRDINFAALLEDPRLQDLVAPHLGAHWIMYASTSSSVPPLGTNYASRLHVDSPRHQLGYMFNIGLIWTLDDYTPTNGAMEILPGSQHVEAPPTEELFAREAVRVLCPAGTLIVFNARTFHRTTPSLDVNWRHSMTMNACRSFMKQRMDWVRTTPRQISDQLNEQARRLIGFDTRLPTTLDEFYVPLQERLYKPGQG